VHAAIQVKGEEGELPPYVPRDLDADLRAAVTASADSGGFVLLVGGSSVGKTRALCEAVREDLAEWWLLHPADTAVLEAFAAQPTARTVVWLDELQRYLDHPGGLPVGVLRTLLTAGVVVVATLWPDEYNTRTVPRIPGQPDPCANDRELLGLARMVSVPEVLSRDERRRAETLATDLRIRTALDTPDAGFAQVMAAGPALVNHWENAPANQCYGKAVITAALDARRVGATAHVTREFLNAAAPAYLTPAQRATAPVDWLDHAMAYATTPLHGAASTLAPVPAGMGRIGGYAVADYLYQHARGVRRAEQLPDSAWQALLDHHDPKDAFHLGEHAQRRGQHHYAEALYRFATDGGDEIIGAVRLALSLADRGRTADSIGVLRAHPGDEIGLELEAGIDLLARQLLGQGDVEGAVAILRFGAEAGNKRSSEELGRLLAKQGQIEQAIAVLRPHADAGSDAGLLDALLAKQGQLDELRQRAEAGDEVAAVCLARQGQVEEAIVFLRQRADAGSRGAPRRLADLLAELGRVEEAIAVLGEHAAAGNGFVSERLVDLLVEEGRVEEAIDFLRPHADAGQWLDAVRLVGLLAKQGQVEELQQRADAGDSIARIALAHLLETQGRIEEAVALLRSHADAGDVTTADWLARMLAKHGRMQDAIGVLRPHADAGSDLAAGQLASLLAQQGNVQELRERADAGDPNAADRLAGLLTERGDVDELRQRANAGDQIAATRLARLLAERGDIDELKLEVAAGTPRAAELLRSLTNMAQEGPIVSRDSVGGR
jgi:tetratricopeptide (TPR) repeat protein